MRFVATFLLIAMAFVLLNLLAKRGRERREDVEGATRRPARKIPGVEQTAPCEVCGTYRAVSDKSSCDRSDCPYSQST